MFLRRSQTETCVLFCVYQLRNARHTVCAQMYLQSAALWKNTNLFVLFFVSHWHLHLPFDDVETSRKINMINLFIQSATRNWNLHGRLLCGVSAKCNRYWSVVCAHEWKKSTLFSRTFPFDENISLALAGTRQAVITIMYAANWSSGTPKVTRNILAIENEFCFSFVLILFHVCQSKFYQFCLMNVSLSVLPDSAYFIILFCFIVSLFHGPHTHAHTHSWTTNRISSS